jgi:hypothetical protein
MTNCTICQKEIEKDQEFILDGKFPGFIKTLTNEIARNPFPDYLTQYGNISHKDCYLNQNK